jgi:uncharacterized membrane protein (UPF0127 family)
MKKNNHKKNTSNKQSRFAVTNTAIRNALLVVLCAGLFFSSMYGYRCLVEKVCDSVMIDKIVRHDVTVLMPKGALEVEVANTKPSRELGLSYRPSMGDDEGMLFVFPVPGRYGFWMKDMLFSLDMVWINENGIVVWIERGVTPESYTEKKTFINQSDASYVLEMNAGLAEKFGLYLGSKIKIAE